MLCVNVQGIFAHHTECSFSFQLVKLILHSDVCDVYARGIFFKFSVFAGRGGYLTRNFQ